MPPIRRSNRARKPKVHWEPPPPARRPPTRKQQPPLFTIHADPPEDLTTQLHEGLIKGLSPQLSEEDLSDTLSLQLSDEDLSNALSIQLSDKDLSKVLNVQLYKDLGVNLSYQSQFLSKDRADKSQNLSEDSTSVKLFQLFFTVKEIKNIVKQINQ